MDIIQLRKHFFLESAFVFTKWLPTFPEFALDITIDEINLVCYVDLNYTDTSEVGDILENEISRTNFRIITLFVLLNVPVENASDKSLYEMNPPSCLLTKVAQALRKFESSIYSIVRNDIGQYWLPNSHEIDALSDEEILTGVQIRHEEKWRQFCIAVIKGKSYIPEQDIHINSDRWIQLKNLIEENYRCDLSMVFYRNAQKYLKEGNSRLAMIEVCIALERAINVYINDHLSIELKTEFNSIIKGDSLTEKVEKLLPKLLPDDFIDETVIKNCIEAVNLRNKIIHRCQVKDTDLNANLYLKEIKRILDKLIVRKFSKIN